MLCGRGGYDKRCDAVTHHPLHVLDAPLVNRQVSTKIVIYHSILYYTRNTQVSGLFTDIPALLRFVGGEIAVILWVASAICVFSIRWDIV
jgi:hypothetical protein